MEQQLTFGNLQTEPSRRLSEVNVTVAKDEKPRFKHQAAEILKRLRKRPVWTHELRDIAAQYNARIREIREQLMPLGETVDRTAKGGDGNNCYEIRPFHGSKYEAYLMAKQRKNTEYRIQDKE